MLDDHIGEHAELYALGQLDELESSRVERHARTCDACARRLGEAEEAVLGLIESGDVAAEPPIELDRRVRFSGQPPRAWIAAVAAAFLVGLLPWGVTTLRHSDQGTGSNQQLAMNAMLAGHFLHVPVAPLSPGCSAGESDLSARGWLALRARRPHGPVSRRGSDYRQPTNDDRVDRARFGSSRCIRRDRAASFERRASRQWHGHRLRADRLRRTGAIEGCVSDRTCR